MESAALTAALAGLISLAASFLFLRTRNFRFDAVAVAVTEVGLIFLALSIVAGIIRGHSAHGLWWTWDGGLTSALICWLLYAAYLLLRRSVEEPTQRATFAAVFSIFAFLDVPIVVVCVSWWVARRPSSSVSTEWTTLNAGIAVAMTAVGALLAVTRFRREQRQREQDAQRREAHLVS
jgi:heme exporter protein C